MPLSFRTVSITAGAFFFVLACVWLLVPQFFLWVFQVDSPEAALFVARRGAALFLGMGAMLLLARDAEPSIARDAMATGLAISCAALSILGVVEFGANHAGAGIWLAIIGEIALAMAFWRARHSPSVTFQTKPKD
jgi:hypothetical protein